MKCDGQINQEMAKPDNNIKTDNFTNKISFEADEAKKKQARTLTDEVNSAAVKEEPIVKRKISKDIEVC
jgi:hypothetical protein